MHPSPTLFSAVGWRSPISGVVRISADITDAHPECGNGVEWFLQHRTLKSVGTIWKGEISTRGSKKMKPRLLTVRKGELISFYIGPRHRTHACDLTRINLEVRETKGKKRVWNLANDVRKTLHMANPHPDRYGNRRTWHFFKGPMTKIQKTAPNLIARAPPGSLLATWLAEGDSAGKADLAERIKQLAMGARPKKKSPDQMLYDQLHSITLPIDHQGLLKQVKSDARFGKHPRGGKVAANDVVAKASSNLSFEIPAELANGRQLEVTAVIDAGAPSKQLSVQMHASVGKPVARKELRAGEPVVVVPNSQAHRRVKEAMATFRNLFPAAVCYSRIVPVDEVVTLTLFFREDAILKRLMLTTAEARELEKLWDELYYVSHEPLKLVVAFEQISEFATQDRPDLVIAFKVLKKPINDRAEAFKKRLVATEPAHVQAVLKFADRAWRRPLSAAEQQKLRQFYGRLRKAGVAHQRSIQLMLARVLTSPVFLYKLEKPAPGKKATDVSNAELASRLSYFLWSTAPDSKLRVAADSGKLTDPSELLRQTRRMLRDGKTRRLAEHFALQWLHIRNFDKDAEKNEKRFPEFAKLRSDMYEESLRFFEDLFRNDRSILSMFNADHAFLNDRLAKLYGVNASKGWQRVDGVRSKGRGGVLGMATVLASQSGASRTSPILRGNWVYETLLGEKLPKPPAKVPTLPESVPTGLTARQLIERHSSVPACAKCHSKIDGYGFSLEQYDAIGRLRVKRVDTKTKLPDGKTIEGIDGLRRYLVQDRRKDVVRQFCRKLLGYALGREVQLSDEPMLDEMQSKLKAKGYRFRVAVEAIVTSRQFLRIRGRSK